MMLYEKFQKNSRKIPVKFQKNSQKIPKKFQQNSRKNSRKIPAKFQKKVFFDNLDQFEMDKNEIVQCQLG